MSSVRITVLVENSVSQRGLLAEHGLSFWIESGSRRVLFDTGQTAVLVHNARVLGIDLATADAIVLSHGHFDHTGGLAAAMEIAPRARLLLHPAALEPKFSRHADGTWHDVGMPREAQNLIRRRSAGLVYTTEPTPVAEGIFVTGPIPRITGYEDTGGAFFHDERGEAPDPLWDDQAITISTTAGIVLLLGCAHAGVINTLEHVRRSHPGTQVRAIIGGMHLSKATPARLSATLAALEAHEGLEIAPAHCTGRRATALLGERFGPRCRVCEVGTRFELD